MLIPFVCYNQQECDHLPAAYQQKSTSAGQEGYLPCPTNTFHQKLLEINDATQIWQAMLSFIHQASIQQALPYNEKPHVKLY